MIYILLKKTMTISHIKIIKFISILLKALI